MQVKKLIKAVKRKVNLQKIKAIAATSGIDKQINNYLPQLTDRQKLAAMFSETPTTLNSKQLPSRHPDHSGLQKSCRPRHLPNAICRTFASRPTHQYYWAGHSNFNNKY